MMLENQQGYRQLFSRACRGRGPRSPCLIKHDGNGQTNAQDQRNLTAPVKGANDPGGNHGCAAGNLAMSGFRHKAENLVHVEPRRAQSKMPTASIAFEQPVAQLQQVRDQGTFCKTAGFAGLTQGGFLFSADSSAQSAPCTVAAVSGEYSAAGALAGGGAAGGGAMFGV